jgi:hypothetical protein
MIPLPSRHLLITVAIIVVSFFLLLWANERYSSYISSRDTTAETEWLAAKENWKRVHAKIKEVTAAAARADTVILREKARSASALRYADSLRRVRATIPEPVFSDSTNPVWRRLYFSALGEADSLRAVHNHDAAALAASEFSRDSLRAVLLLADTAGTRVVDKGQRLIDVKTCKVLWLIACPSRRVVAVASGVLGLAAGVYVERQRK